MKLGRKYFIVNIDEPYAEEIFAILKKGQMAKNEWPEGGINFEEWKRQTFGEDSDKAKKIDTSGERLTNLESRLGQLEFRLVCLETMPRVAKNDCQHDWVEELQDIGHQTITGTVPRKMRCRKCLIVQYIY